MSNFLYNVICPNCGAQLRVTEMEAKGMAGCYEREEAVCPICNAVVASKRTDGVLNATLI